MLGIQTTMSGVRPVFWVCLALVVVTLAIYGQVSRHDFINYDDGPYVTENVFVNKGLSLDGVTWAFTTFYEANWHPLTWISHMVDVQLYGLAAGGHHLINLLLHILNALLLFLVFRRATGKLWQSAFVAALFALHPLRVESVAWVAERKDVLSTLFWMLTLFSYVRYTENRTAYRYTAALIFFAAGLMSKPMVVTLPAVLLLMDLWPLKRFQLNALDGKPGHRAWMLLMEKVPFFLLSVGVSVLTYAAQQSVYNVGSLTTYPLSARIANAMVSYAGYIVKMVWPYPLFIPYLHPGYIPALHTAGAFFLLFAVTLAVGFAARRWPYAAIGWLWYLGTLIPVIGIIQVGYQSMADRYTYLPMIGLYIIIAWGGADLADKRRWKKGSVAAIGIAVVTALSTATFFQVRHWTNSISLFSHVVRVDPNNFVAHNHLGLALMAADRVDEAIDHYEAAIRIDPSHFRSINNLGTALMKKGRIDAAMDQFSAALEIQPAFASAHYNLGNTMATLGRFPEAVDHYRTALGIDAKDADIHNNLGVALMRNGNLQEATLHFRWALDLDGDHADAHNNFGFALLKLGQIQQAVHHFREALRLNPRSSKAKVNLQMALAAENQVISQRVLGKSDDKGLAH